MGWQINQTEPKDKGFTLVELLIVVVILGILATVTVFAVRGITDRGKNSACKADQKTLQIAIEAYYALNSSATIPTEADLVTAELMREQSVNLTVDGAGLVIVDVAVATNPCTGLITPA